jgi:hypothetical protein
MKIKLLISLFGLIPALVIAEVTVNQTPKGGESVAYTPSSTAGRTASGAMYEKTTTAPDVSTLEVEGVNGGNLSRTTTTPGSPTLEAEGHRDGPNLNGIIGRRIATAPK